MPSESGIVRSLLFFAIAVRFLFFSASWMDPDLFKAPDEMRGFIETAQKLVDAWDAQLNNYTQFEGGNRDEG